MNSASFYYQTNTSNLLCNDYQESFGLSDKTIRPICLNLRNNCFLRIYALFLTLCDMSFLVNVSGKEQLHFIANHLKLSHSNYYLYF